MLIVAEEHLPASSGLIDTLEEQAFQLYRRPYLPRGTAERTLILLNCLLQFTSPGRDSGSIGGSGGQGTSSSSSSWLRSRLAQLCEAVAEEVGSYAASCLQQYWTPIDAAQPESQVSGTLQLPKFCCCYHGRM